MQYNSEFHITPLIKYYSEVQVILHFTIYTCLGKHFHNNCSMKTKNHFHKWIYTKQLLHISVFFKLIGDHNYHYMLLLSNSFTKSYRIWRKTNFRQSVTQLKFFYSDSITDLLILLWHFSHTNLSSYLKLKIKLNSKWKC